MENFFEVAEVLEAAEKFLEERADTDRTLWVVIAALRSCREYLDEQSEALQ